MIRTIKLPKDFKALTGIYQRAFADFPWFENLTDEEIESRLESQFAKPGFQGFVLESMDVVGAVWWDTPTLDALVAERGFEFAQFCAKQYYDRLVWEREVIVDPIFQGQGIATQLRLMFLETLESQKGITLITTRMRSDNVGIIKIASRLKFQRTGILVPSSQKPEVHHEYWWKIVGGIK